MHLGEVMAQRHLALAAQGVLQGLGADVGVAVAVAANPVAHAQEVVLHAGAQHVLQVGIELGNFAQKSGFVVAQRVLDFVVHAQFAVAQQPGLPQLHHPGANLRLIGGQLARRERVGALGAAFAVAQDVIARRQQLGDGALGVQNTFALHLGRVCGKHRRDKAVRQAVRHGFVADTGPAHARERHFQAALLGVASAVMDGAAADMVPVFGQIGQVAEVGEGANHAHGLVGA